MLHFFHAALIPCCIFMLFSIFFILHYFHATSFRISHFSCYTFFVLHFFHVALFPCFTSFALLRFALFSCYTFSSCTLFILHFFHAASFPCCTFFVVIFSFCTILGCTISTLCLFHVALSSCCIIFMYSFRVTLFLCFALLHVALFKRCNIFDLHPSPVALLAYCTFCLLHCFQSCRQDLHQHLRWRALQ